MPARRNSPYASSTTTMPPGSYDAAASHSIETASGGSAVPVGLLGLGSSTTRRPPLQDQLAGGVEVEGEVLGPVPGHPLGEGVAGVLGIHRVRRREATARTRPGPPKACSSCSITSLEPLAAHTMSGVMPLPPDVLRYAASALAQLDELAVGVAVERHRRLADGARDVGRRLGRGTVGVLVDVELDRRLLVGELGRAVGLDPPQLVAQGRERARSPSRPVASNRTETAWP